jgi:hypothetical protein
MLVSWRKGEMVVLAFKYLLAPALVELSKPVERGIQLLIHSDQQLFINCLECLQFLFDLAPETY